MAIGGVQFYDWSIPIEVCLCYGDYILISYKPITPLFTIIIHTLSNNKYPINIDRNTTVDDLKEIMKDIDGIPIDQQRLLGFGKELTEQDESLYEKHGVRHGTVFQLYIRLGGVGHFTFIAECGVNLRWFEEKMPSWRYVHFGLFSEGRCTNTECEAYKRLVVMNMGSPVIYKIGFPGQQPTCCPLCQKYVKPETFGFNNCWFRSIGIKEGANGRVKQRSEWMKLGDEYYRFEGSNLDEWIRLI